MIKATAIITLILVAVGVGFFVYHEMFTRNSLPTGNLADQTGSSSVQSIVATSSSHLNTYDNFGITFQYPSEWGMPVDSFYGNGLASIYFDYGGAAIQPFDVLVGQDTDPGGKEPLNETLDQMIARFRTNDQYIYDVKDISADGVKGNELFYNDAQTSKPYHVEAYFPFRNGLYISLGADYQSVPQKTFDLIISTLKWDNTTVPKFDHVTGMTIYDNNGIRFEYPEKFSSDFASLTLKASVAKVNSTMLDSNGCYPVTGENGKPSSSSMMTISGIKFCYSTISGVGAGQLYNDYTYMTFRNGNAYSVDYLVNTSNGCGAYGNSTDLGSSENQKYNQCLDFTKNYNSIVLKTIQNSIATFMFTD